MVQDPKSGARVEEQELFRDQGDNEWLRLETTGKEAELT